jgi:hypothetical protein
MKEPLYPYVWDKINACFLYFFVYRHISVPYFETDLSYLPYPVQAWDTRIFATGGLAWFMLF